MTYAIHATKGKSKTFRIVFGATETHQEMSFLRRTGWEIMTAYCCDGMDWKLL